MARTADSPNGGYPGPWTAHTTDSRDGRADVASRSDRRLRCLLLLLSEMLRGYDERAGLWQTLVSDRRAVDRLSPGDGSACRPPAADASREKNRVSVG